MTGEGIRTEAPMEMFRELVEGAIGNQHLEPSKESAFYLVRLLDGFVRPAGPYADVGAPPERALAELLLTAIQADGPRRFVLFQVTGDLALFVSGFFGDSLERRHATPGYYRQLGETAYSQAADCCQPRCNAPLFEELSASFAPFTGVLQEVSERCLVDMGHLLRLYERWSATGSPRAAELLRSRGLAVGPGSGLVH